MAIEALPAPPSAAEESIESIKKKVDRLEEEKPWKDPDLLRRKREKSRDDHVPARRTKRPEDLWPSVKRLRQEIKARWTRHLCLAWQLLSRASRQSLLRYILVNKPEEFDNPLSYAPDAPCNVSTLLPDLAVGPLARGDNFVRYLRFYVEASVKDYLNHDFQVVRVGMKSGRLPGGDPEAIYDSYTIICPEELFGNSYEHPGPDGAADGIQKLRALGAKFISKKAYCNLVARLHIVYQTLNAVACELYNEYYKQRVTPLPLLEKPWITCGFCGGPSLEENGKRYMACCCNVLSAYCSTKCAAKGWTAHEAEHRLLLEAAAREREVDEKSAAASPSPAAKPGKRKSRGRNKEGSTPAALMPPGDEETTHAS